MRKEIAAVGFDGKDQKEDEEKKTPLKWSKSMEIGLVDVVLSLAKEKMKLFRIHTMLKKIYRGMTKVHVAQKLKTLEA